MSVRKYTLPILCITVCMLAVFIPTVDLTEADIVMSTTPTSQTTQAAAHTLYAQKAEEAENTTRITVSGGQACINDSYSDLSKALNLYLYDVCQTYLSDFKCGDISLSPLLPLAEANNEGGRVDTSETFSGMAPTAVYDFSSVGELRDFNVTRVLDSEATWLAMTTEYSTRDRGALQCNPGYGSDDVEYGTSEYELLTAYITDHPEVLNYSSNKDTCGVTFNVSKWINSSRTKLGDRFHVESIIRLFAAEKQSETAAILAKFGTVESEYQVYAIMAYLHWMSGFLGLDASRPYAGFQTIGRAYEYCAFLGTDGAVSTIRDKCMQDILEARSAGKNPPSYIGTTTATQLFETFVQRGLCKEWDYYFRHTPWSPYDQGVTACTYAIQIIYSVIQMELLYSGY